MEKSSTEREFQTNYNVCVKKVSYKSLMLPGHLYELLIEVVMFPVF